MLLLAFTHFAAPAQALQPFQSGVAREANECVSWAPGRVDCFSRSTTGSLTWVYLQNEQWSAPKDLGGKLAAAPSCVARGPGGINCFATSAKGVLATINLNGRIWSNWASLGGDLLPSRPACVALARDRIACYARGRRGQLMLRRWSGGKTWDPWQNLGGSLSADPDCIAVGGAGIACFARDTRGELAAFFPDATGKTGGWAALGGRIESTPSCVRLKSGEAACAAQGRSGRLHLWRGMPLFQGEDPGRIIPSDESTIGEPACVVQLGVQVCFLRNERRQLVRRTLSSGADTSHDGALDLPAASAVSCLPLDPDGGMGCVLTDPDRKLYFAAGSALEASAPAEPEVAAADDDPEGAWYLSNVDSGAACRVVLTGRPAFGGKRIQVGPRCRAVGLGERPAQWDQDDKGLLFLARDGEVLLRFNAAHAGRWMTARKTAPLMLSREPPGETPAPAVIAGPADARLTDMFGPWRVVNDGAGYLCTLQLTNRRIESGYEIAWDPGCESRFPSVRYWTESAASIVFVGPNDIVVARFDQNGPGKWRLQGHAGIALLR